MAKIATNSWTLREKLLDREAFETHGALWALADGQWNGVGKLPPEWAARFMSALTPTPEGGGLAYVVHSYSTPIGWVLKDGTVVIPPVKYSRTTSGHQGKLYALSATDPDVKFGIRNAALRERQAARDKRAAQRRAVPRPVAQFDSWTGDALPPAQPLVEHRPVPRNSGEGAIYSEEFLKARELRRRAKEAQAKTDQLLSDIEKVMARTR